MDSLRQDLLYALRSLRRRPGFTVVVVLTLAVAIGPLTAIFSVVDAVLLKPLAFAEPERVVQIWSGAGAKPHGPTSSANFLDVRALNRSFEAMAAEDFGWFNLTSDAADGRPERLHGARVSPSFFRVLGVQPALGRTLRQDEERPDARVAVLSHGLWVRQFGGDRRLVGTHITLNGERWLVAGVMPEGFDFPTSLTGRLVELWTPLAWSPNDVQRGMRELGITARLRSGVTPAQAQRDLDAVASRLERIYPRENTGVHLNVVPVREELVGKTRRTILVLFGAVGLVLLIACANVANLSLTRASARQREIFIRAALGAGRGRIVRQLLTESILLACAAATLGALGAVWLTDVLVALTPIALPRAGEIGVDGRVLAFVSVVAVVTGIIFGAAPALQLSTTRIGDSLRGAGRALTAGRERRRAGGVMVVLEVAMALVLLVGAGLLIRSLERLVSVNPGFEAGPVLTTRMALPSAKYGAPDQQRRYIEEGVSRLAALPGVAQAAAVDYLPFGQSDASLDMTIDGRAPALHDVEAHYRSISPAYPEAMQIALIRGRAFTAADREHAPLVAIVNDAMARRYWPGADPVGRRIRVGGPETQSPWLTVVGVIGSVKHWNLRETPQPELYVPLAQSPTASFTFVLRASRSAAAVIEPARVALHALDREQPVRIEPLGTLVSRSVAEPRFRGVLLGGFAAIALALAVVGIYGLISFGVTQRTREVGVRIALGAQRTDIVGLVLREGMTLTLAGVVLGLGGALAVTRVLEGMLFEVPRTDVATFVAVSSLLIVTAAIANYIPARRAAKVDPVVALQAD